MITEYIKILKQLGFTPTTVLEIGAREGGDACHFRDAFGIKNSDVYVVEPNPEILPHMWCKEFNLFEVAIGPEAGTKKFYQVHGNGDVMGTCSLRDRNDDWYKRNRVDEIVVKVMTGKELLRAIDRDIDICKIDVEGTTWEVLDSFGSDLTRIKTMHVETEAFAYWTVQKLHDDVVRFLEDAGYVMQWSSDGLQRDSIWIHKTLL